MDQMAFKEQGSEIADYINRCRHDPTIVKTQDLEKWLRSEYGKSGRMTMPLINAIGTRRKAALGETNFDFSEDPIIHFLLQRRSNLFPVGQDNPDDIGKAQTLSRYFEDLATTYIGASRRSHTKVKDKKAYPEKLLREVLTCADFPFYDSYQNPANTLVVSDPRLMKGNGAETILSLTPEVDYRGKMLMLGDDNDIIRFALDMANHVQRVEGIDAKYAAKFKKEAESKSPGAMKEFLRYDHFHSITNVAKQFLYRVKGYLPHIAVIPDEDRWLLKIDLGLEHKYSDSAERLIPLPQ